MTNRNIFEKTIDKLIERTQQGKQLWVLEPSSYNLVTTYKTKLNDTLEFIICSYKKDNNYYNCLFIENGIVVGQCDTDNVDYKYYEKLFNQINCNFSSKSIRHLLEEFIKED